MLDQARAMTAGPVRQVQDFKSGNEAAALAARDGGDDPLPYPAFPFDPSLELLRVIVQRAAGIHPEFTTLRPYFLESTPGNLSPEWTAGGMVSSASDLVRWARAIRDGELLGPDPVAVYRGRKGGEPVAAVLTPVAPDGYAGRIKLLVAINYDGSLAGVRVIVLTSYGRTEAAVEAMRLQAFDFVTKPDNWLENAEHHHLEEF